MSKVQLTPVIIFLLSMAGLLLVTACLSADQKPVANDDFRCDLVVIAGVSGKETEILDEGLHRTTLVLDIIEVLHAGSQPAPAQVRIYDMGGIRGGRSGQERLDSDSLEPLYWCLKDLSAHDLPWAVINTGTADQAKSWPLAHPNR